MLDWCRNFHLDQQLKNQIAFRAEANFTQSTTKMNQKLPKFIKPPTQQGRRIGSSVKKGITIHVNKSQQQDKKVQTIPNYKMKAKLVDCQTQTTNINIRHLNNSCNTKSLACSRQPSPLSRLQNTNFLKIQANKSYLCNTNDIRQRDSKNQIYKQTKASNCVYQSKDLRLKLDNNFYSGLANIQSYHIPYSNRSNKQESTALANLQSKIKYKINYQTGNEKMVQSIKKTINQQPSSATFSQKYKNMLKNVESEFKLSSLKSQKKLKHTPERRILFHDRQTILSKYNDQSVDQQKSMRIQQSIIYQPDVKQYFTPVGLSDHYQYFHIYHAIQNRIGMMVSIKEISVNHMNYISQELLIYKQLGLKRIKIAGILQLYQTQIDRESYLFIKEAYCQSLAHYLMHNKHYQQIEKQICTIIAEMQENGFYLKVLPNLSDFVVSFNEIKMQSLGIFQFSPRGILISEVIRQIKQQIKGYLL